MDGERGKGLFSFHLVEPDFAFITSSRSDGILCEGSVVFGLIHDELPCSKIRSTIDDVHSHSRSSDYASRCIKRACSSRRIGWSDFPFRCGGIRFHFQLEASDYSASVPRKCGSVIGIRYQTATRCSRREGSTRARLSLFGLSICHICTRVVQLRRCDILRTVRTDIPRQCHGDTDNCQDVRADYSSPCRYLR